MRSGSLPIGLQAKLLRVIEDKEFYRLGDSRTVKVDVRILSATNRDLEGHDQNRPVPGRLALPP